MLEHRSVKLFELAAVLEFLSITLDGYHTELFRIQILEATKWPEMPEFQETPKLLEKLKFTSPARLPAVRHLAIRAKN